MKVSNRLLNKASKKVSNKESESEIAYISGLSVENVKKLKAENSLN